MLPLWMVLALSCFASGLNRKDFVNENDSISPNIVFIMVDDLGWNDVGYHNSEIATPNLDRLAMDGVRLEQYYTAPVCGPTRAQFLSGKYSIHIGIPGNILACHRSGLTTNVPTIADKLKEQGYSTHMIGKWHAGFHSESLLPTNRGFDTFRGHLLGHGDHYTHTRKYNGEPYLDFYRDAVPSNDSWGRYSTEIFTERAVDIIRTDESDDKPLFLFLSYQAPHNPLQVPERYLEQYSVMTDGQRKSYSAMVSAIDEGVGEIVDALTEKGLYDNTVIIFTSDNGGDVGSGGSNYPLRGNKGSLYQGGIRSVGFVSSPLIARPERSVRDLIHVTDWLPTLLHIAGGNVEKLDIDGVNQWNTISTASPSPRQEILHNIGLDKTWPRRRNRYDNFNIRTKAALTVWPWKILTGRQSRNIVYPNPVTNLRRWQEARWNRPKSSAEVQLFNIELDPSESRNRASDKPQLVNRLLDKLKEYEQTVMPSVSTRKTALCDPALRGGIWGPYT
ncbi:arylsulfatase J-like [Watersipora subatra]|uniref:arylsulfatase J-like n=1 Tax=Watersipora subatra TaxID=2589382 RepID=UPI00355B0269